MCEFRRPGAGEGELAVVPFLEGRILKRLIWENALNPISMCLPQMHQISWQYPLPASLQHSSPVMVTQKQNWLIMMIIKGKEVNSKGNWGHDDAVYAAKFKHIKKIKITCNYMLFISRILFVLLYSYLLEESQFLLLDYYVPLGNLILCRLQSTQIDWKYDKLYLFFSSYPA